MKYINTKTRMIIDSECSIEGDLWKPLEEAKKAPKEEAPKAEPKEETEPVEVKEEPKAEKKTTKTAAKNTVKPRKR